MASEFAAAAPRRAVLMQLIFKNEASHLQSRRHLFLNERACFHLGSLLLLWIATGPGEAESDRFHRHDPRPDRAERRRQDHPNDADAWVADADQRHHPDWWSGAAG